MAVNMAVSSTLFLLLFFLFLAICSSNNTSIFDNSSSFIDMESSLYTESLLLLPTLTSLITATTTQSLSSPFSSSYSSSYSVSSVSISITEPTFSSPAVVITPSAISSSLIPLQSTPVVNLISGNLTLQFSSSTTSCSCDLTVQSCDTNCCCDNDCTSSEREAFSICLNQQQDDNVIADPLGKGCLWYTCNCLIEIISTPNIQCNRTLVRNCLPSTTLFRTSLLATRCSDMFCVYTDNYPGRHMFPDTPLADTLNELNRQLTLYSKTGDQTTPISQYTPTNSANMYRSGDILSITYDTSIYGYLTLPTSLNGDTCHDGNPITYLNDVKTQCTRYLSESGNECVSSSLLNPLLYYENISLSLLPGNTSDTTSLDARNVNCLNLIGQSESCDSLLTPHYNSTSLTCRNVLINLRYFIFHNGSNGVVQALYDATIREVPVGPISQEFSVTFISVASRGTNYTALLEETFNSIKRSGNPGYIDGEPVLGGNLSSSNTINVQSDRANWLTLLTAGSGGICNGDQRKSVTFRDNMKTSCIMRVSSSLIQSGCTNIGSQARTLLLGRTTVVDRIAIYGNSDPRNLSQWIPVFGLSDVPTTFECTSIITGIHITILYSYSGQVGSPQAFITGARINYITQDITTQCPSLGCSSSLILSLQSSVTFIPSYSVPAQVLKSTTLTARTVPEDFLYPLLFPSNSNGNKLVNYNTLLMTLCTVIASFMILFYLQ